jgi:cell division protein FtsB
MTTNSSQSLSSLPFRPSRKPRLILIFLIALCGLFVYSYTMRLVEKAQVEARIVEMKGRIEGAKNVQYSLLEQREGLSEPDYLDRVARENFGLAKPGDKVLVVIKEPIAASPSAEAPAAAAAVTPVELGYLPVWQQWISFFTTEELSLSDQ